MRPDLNTVLRVGLARNDRILPQVNGDVSVKGYGLDFAQAEPTKYSGTH